MRAMSDHCAAIIDMQKGGSVCFDYATTFADRLSKPV